MILNNLNLNSLLVFSRVYALNSMTLASKELAMTQPGISQHIKSLEQDLNIQLFIRDRKRIIPTKAAVTLYQVSSELIANLQKTLSRLVQDDGFLSAEVIIGAPIEFGINVLMPKLALLNLKHPEIKFHLRYGLAKEMNGLLEKGEVDFAFVDNFQSSKGVNYEQVYNEELVLCCSKKYLNGHKVFDKPFFQTKSYVSYFEEQTILREWFKTAMGFKKIDINAIMRTEDAQGVFSFIKHDMGIGVIPKHMIKNSLFSNNLHVFTPKYKSVYNAISLSYLEKRIEGPFLNFIYNHFRETFINKLS